MSTGVGRRGMTRRAIDLAARRRPARGAHRLGREQHVLGGYQGADASERRGAHQSVLCRAAVCGGARRPQRHGIACSSAPPADSVIVLSAWHWDLSTSRARSTRALGRIGRPAGGRPDAGRRRARNSSAGRASSASTAERDDSRGVCGSRRTMRDVPHFPGRRERDAVQRVA